MRYSILLGWSFLFDGIQDNCDIILAYGHGTVHILDFVRVMEYGLVSWYSGNFRDYFCYCGVDFQLLPISKRWKIFLEKRLDEFGERLSDFGN